MAPKFYLMLIFPKIIACVAMVMMSRTAKINIYCYDNKINKTTTTTKLQLRYK